MCAYVRGEAVHTLYPDLAWRTIDVPARAAHALLSVRVYLPVKHPISAVSFWCARL
jgi:hypothetical protein